MKSLFSGSGIASALVVPFSAGLLAGACSTVPADGTLKPIAIECGDAMDACSGLCVDLQTDALHCGSCEKACPKGVACVKGACSLTCNGGLEKCGTACVDVQNDAQNCSKCGMACMPPANSTSYCAAGKCGSLCQTGFEDCNAKSDDGCEADLAKDPLHCGSCAVKCPTPAHGTAGCTASKCGLASCEMGFDDCDKSADNGCEVTLASDQKNCGMCGMACTATQICQAGKCIDSAPSCKAIKAADPNAKDGLYQLDVDGPAGPKPPYQAYCEMTTDKGGWEVMAYIRNNPQYDTGTFADFGQVGDAVNGFATGMKMASVNGTFTERIIIYLKLIEQGQDLGKQFMVTYRSNMVPVPFNPGINQSSGWAYRDSFNYTDANAGNVCSHGCNSYRGFGMFHDGIPALSYCGTQGGNYGCPDGNNICWGPRGLGCNVGAGRCAALKGNGEGVIYAAR
jgi:hypothetical protein